MSQAQQGFWSRVWKALKPYMSKATMKKAASFLLTKIGINPSGLYLWFTANAMNKAWKKYGQPFFDRLTYKLDRKKIDDANLAKLKENETNGATSEEKISDELDFLNGNKPKP